MIRNIKETFLPKTGMRKATSCKIQGMLRWSIHAACCMVWAKESSIIVFTVNVDTVDTVQWLVQITLCIIVLSL